jgi:hypothetical protein
MGSAVAHNVPNGLVYPAATPLGSTNAYDVYHTTCFTDTNFVEADTVNNGPANRLRAQVAGVTSSTAGANEAFVKVTVGYNDMTGLSAPAQTQASCTDLINGAASATPYCNPTGVPGTQNSAILAKGNGDYDIAVSHPLNGATGGASTGTNTYNVQFHCETAGSVHTGTGVKLTTVGGAVTAVGFPYFQLVNY